MAKLTWLPKKTFELEFEVPWSEVKKTYDHVLGHFVDAVKLKGFRKGKAPKDLVEKSVDKADVYGEVINHLLPKTYAAAVAEHKLRPAMAPKITIVSAEENKAWQFKATACELPEIKLNDYQKAVKGTLAKEAIWTPGKGDPKKTDKTELTETQKLNLISRALLETAAVDLPDLMIQAETDRLLSRLLDQIQKLGLTIDQYASSNQKTVDQVKAEYRQAAVNSLKLELILASIGDEKKFTAKETDVDKMIAAAGDDKLKKQLNTPSERAYIASVLRKRQVIDYLLAL